MSHPIRDLHEDPDEQSAVSDEEAIRQLEEEGIIMRSTERRATLEEVLQELEEMWRKSPPKPGGLARFLESRE